MTFAMTVQKGVAISIVKTPTENLVPLAKGGWLHSSQGIPLKITSKGTNYHD